MSLLYFGHLGKTAKLSVKLRKCLGVIDHSLSKQINHLFKLYSTFLSAVYFADKLEIIEFIQNFSLVTFSLIRVKKYQRQKLENAI